MFVRDGLAGGTGLPSAAGGNRARVREAWGACYLLDWRALDTLREDRPFLDGAWVSYESESSEVARGKPMAKAMV